MNPMQRLYPSKQKRLSGMTLVEMLITVGLGTIVIGMIWMVYVFGLRSFAAMSNYAEMDGKSRQAVDLMLREIRSADKVLTAQSSGSSRTLTVADTAGSETNTFQWSSGSGLLTWSKTGQAARTLLTGCDDWSFTLYLRVADSNGNFYVTSDPGTCKLINMAWKCSRNNILKKINTESVVTAEVVLRNKL
jgi:Tfp pilus assembly protein PilW